MSMKTMMESMRRGAAAGTRIAVTGRVEYRSPIQVKSAKDHKAQNVCMIIATTAYSILPIIGFGSAIVCVALGQSVAAAFGALIGAVTAGPQIIQEIRKKR